MMPVNIKGVMFVGQLLDVLVLVAPHEGPQAC